MARKVSLFRAAGLSWSRDIEVQEIRLSLWPGLSAMRAKGCRTGLGGVVSVHEVGPLNIC